MEKLCIHICSFSFFILMTHVVPVCDIYIVDVFNFIYYEDHCYVL